MKIVNLFLSCVVALGISSVATATTPSIVVLAEEEMSESQVYDNALEAESMVSTTSQADKDIPQDEAYSWYLDKRERNGWVYGREIGYENQLETIDGEKFVQRRFVRYQYTGEKNFPVLDDKQSIHVEIKGGPMVGHYKGSYLYDLDAEYGDLEQIKAGFTGETVATYNFDTKYIDPFIGLSLDTEVFSHPRLEWQTDAVAGATFNIAKDKDLTLRYQHTLKHRFYYYGDDDKTYDQDDGFAVGLIGTKYNKDGTSQSLRLEYERFDKGEVKHFEGGWSGYEPKTDNWLLSYKKTF